MERSFLSQVTPVILTYNEEPNIGRCLEPLRAFRRVVVLDSGSTDDTVAIAEGFPNVVVCRRPFDTFAGQWNAALQLDSVVTEWVLAMDADYLMSTELREEIAVLNPTTDLVGYRIRFQYWLLGKPLRGSVYPPLLMLYRKQAVRYEAAGHTMRPRFKGKVAALRSPMLHDDRKPFARWVATQLRYSAEEVERILSVPGTALRTSDRLRRAVVVMPWAVPLYGLLWKRGMLDGLAGIAYAMQRGIAETMIAYRVLEVRVSSGGHDRSAR